MAERRTQPDRRAGEQTGPITGRRAGDHPDADARVRGGRRRGDAFRRLRGPLIGLGLVGAAVPLVRAAPGGEPQEGGEQGEALDEGAAAAAAATAEGLDLEDQLATRIATTREDAEREERIDAAVDRYGISRDLAEDIHDIAIEENIDPQVAFGLVKTESTFDERAISSVGARGLTQVMPRTAAWMQPGTRTADLYDRQTNLRLGFRYLDQMIDKYRGNVRLALLAYNRGPGTVDRVLKQGGNPDNGYADKVLRG